MTLDIGLLDIGHWTLVILCWILKAEEERILEEEKLMK